MHDSLELIIRLDRLMVDHKMSLNELSEKVDISTVNLSILKNGKAKAIRFSTLLKLCEAFDCQPGDIMEVKKGD